MTKTTPLLGQKVEVSREDFGDSDKWDYRWLARVNGIVEKVTFSKEAMTNWIQENGLILV